MQAGASLVLSGGTLANGQGRDAGGSILAQSSASISLTGVTIKNSEATVHTDEGGTTYGGAIALSNGAYLVQLAGVYSPVDLSDFKGVDWGPAPASLVATVGGSESVGELHLWDPDDLAAGPRLTATSGSSLKAVAFSPDGAASPSRPTGRHLFLA